MSRAFISYVKEDAKLVRYILQLLEKNGIPYWQDEEQRTAGMRWKGAIRSAIEEGNFYVAMFSRNWAQRNSTYANEELVQAIDQLRRRPSDRAWFIPVRLDECEIPNREIGGGETLRDLNYIDFPADGWRKSLVKLVRALGVENPIVEQREPLGNGLPSNVTVEFGRIVFHEFDPPLPTLPGSVFAVTGGWIARTEQDDILAYLTTQAPNEHTQILNEQLGLHAFYAVSTDQVVSADPAKPTEFGFTTHNDFPPGIKGWNPMDNSVITIPIAFSTDLHFVGAGTLKDRTIEGTFEAVMIYSLQSTKYQIRIAGTFDLRINPTYDPDPSIGEYRPLR